MKELEPKEFNELLDEFSEWSTYHVKTRDAAWNIVKDHFGTLKCESDEYICGGLELRKVYPPKGIIGECIAVIFPHIKN